jgi:hypothetical protein
LLIGVKELKTVKLRNVHYIARIAGKTFVGRKQGYAFCSRLSEQKTVEGVFVNLWKFADSQDMAARDGKFIVSVVQTASIERKGIKVKIKGINTAGQALHPPPAAASAASRGVLNPSFPHSLDHARASTVAISLRSSIKAAQPLFNNDFPNVRGTEAEDIVRIGNIGDRLVGQRSRGSPNEHVRVKEYFHLFPSKSAAISSCPRVSKSDGTELPFKKPMRVGTVCAASDRFSPASEKIRTSLVHPAPTVSGKGFSSRRTRRSRSISTVCSIAMGPV